MDENRHSWVIVVGASGFVGRYVAEELSTQFNIIKTSRSKRNGFIQFDMAKDSISDVLSLPSKKFKNLSIVLCNKFGPMEDYAMDVDFARKCEVDSIVKISEECRKLKIPITYLSTSYVFPGDKVGYDEGSPVGPISLYGQLKCEAENVLLDNSANLILRLDKIVGISLQSSHLFKEWYDTAKKGQQIRCIKDQSFSPTSVRDVALVVKLSLISKLTGIYHCVNPEVWTRFELAKYFIKKLKLNVSVTSESLKDLGLSEKRPLYSNLNSNKLISELGFSFTKLSTLIENINNINDTYEH